MNEQPSFQSRRELREAERAGLVQPDALPFDGVPRVEKAQVPIEPTGVPLTRRQLRELEKTGGVLAIHTSQIELPTLPVEPIAEQTWAPEPIDSVVAEREEPVTTVNPVVVEPDVVLTGYNAEPEASEPEAAQLEEPVAKPAPEANRNFEYHPDFEALLRGEAEKAGAVKKGNKRRTVLILVAVGLLVVVGGLIAAAALLGIL
ncbi:MAG: hypothetical protein KGL77_06080 [Actinomycetales bacterium]|nr:hypothetical protein [Actinomycetales bacterium]